MSGAYVRGLRVPGECDRCGMEVLLRAMKGESVRGARKSNLVCSFCWDLDHPQNFQGKVKVIDPQSVKNPRPAKLPPP